MYLPVVSLLPYLRKSFSGALGYAGFNLIYFTRVFIGLGEQFLLQVL
jgi:hypothetical protein